MKRQYSENTTYIDIGLRVSGYEIPLDLIELVIATHLAVEEKGGDMTLSETLFLKKKYIEVES